MANVPPSGIDFHRIVSDDPVYTGLVSRRRVLPVALAVSGTPTLKAAKYTLAWDYTNNKLYANTDGLGTWVLVGPSTPATVFRLYNQGLENSSGLSSSENFYIGYTPVALTATVVRFVKVGGTSISVNVKYGANRNGGGSTVLMAADLVVTSETTGDAGTIANPNIPANSYIWLQTSAVSGIVTELNTFLYCTVV